MRAGNNFLPVLAQVAALLLTGGASRAEDGSVLDIFSYAARSQTGDEAAVTFDFSPSGSKWAPGVDEKKVFLAGISGDGWQLGIGRGGQIYSLRGEFGEAVPPQRKGAPWIDEVWQVVATSEKITAPVHDFQNANPKLWQESLPFLFFIHQSGIYISGNDQDSGTVSGPFYSPCLRKRWNKEAGALELVNWAQQARTPCVWKSGVLVFTAYRSAGKGVIEINQVLHNFGEETLDFLNLPWGGVRKSSLPRTLLSQPDGSSKPVEGVWDWKGIPSSPLQDTGGWIAWAGPAEDAGTPALALVFGRNADEPRASVRWGTAGEAERDYEVVERVCKTKLAPGDSLAVRWFLVSGPLDEVCDLANQLEKEAGLREVARGGDVLQPVWADADGLNTSGEGTLWARFHSLPVPGTVPVFLLKDRRTGQQIVTADPYALARTSPIEDPRPNPDGSDNGKTTRDAYHQYADYIDYADLLGFAAREPQGKNAGQLENSENLPDKVRIHASASGLWLPAVRTN